MFYPKSDLCPFNCDKSADISYDNQVVSNQSELARNNDDDTTASSQHCLMKRIREVDFAIIDLNLFLDTHPNCTEALELFSKLTTVSKNLKREYQAKYGPLYATGSSDRTPFDWIEKCYKWPWEM